MNKMVFAFLSEVEKIRSDKNAFSFPNHSWNRHQILSATRICEYFKDYIIDKCQTGDTKDVFFWIDAGSALAYHIMCVICGIIPSYNRGMTRIDHLSLSFIEQMNSSDMTECLKF